MDDDFSLLIDGLGDDDQLVAKAAPTKMTGLTATEGESLWNRTQAKIDAAKAETSMSNNIVVITRVRPFNQREKVHSGSNQFAPSAAPKRRP